MKSYLFIITLPLILLSGCSSVNQPVASIDLVQTGTNQENMQLAQGLVDLLNQNPGEFGARLGGDTLTVYPLFFSATGDRCRYVLQQTSKTLYCSNENANWRLITPVLAELSYN